MSQPHDPIHDSIPPIDSTGSRWLSWGGWTSRHWFGGVALTSVALLAFGLYLQHVVGLEPCPMCIVQRYALMGVAVAALMGWRFKPRWAQLLLWLIALASAGLGAFTAARQSWLQWHPPEVVSCGRDFYGMVESFPLSRAIPMIFRGSGDCTQIDWTFLGGSIANWSFIWFCLFIGVALNGVRLHFRNENVI